MRLHSIHRLIYLGFLRDSLGFLSFIAAASSLDSFHLKRTLFTLLVLYVSFLFICQFSLCLNFSSCNCCVFFPLSFLFMFFFLFRLFGDSLGFLSSIAVGLSSDSLQSNRMIRFDFVFTATAYCYEFSALWIEARLFTVYLCVAFHFDYFSFLFLVFFFYNFYFL